MNIIDNQQKIGGLAAVLASIIYVFGFALILTVMNPIIDETKSSIEKLTFLIENKLLFQLWMLTLYVVFGIVLVPLTIAITANFDQQSFIGKQVAPIFGFIWSGLVIASGMIANVGIDSVSNVFPTDENQALISWQTVDIIQNGLGGGVEVVGGIWVLLTSIAALRNSVFPTFLNYMGIVVGTAGIITMIPGLKAFGAIFGLLQIVWFFWIGIIMIRSRKTKTIMNSVPPLMVFE